MVLSNCGTQHSSTLDPTGQWWTSLSQCPRNSMTTSARQALEVVPDEQRPEMACSCLQAFSLLDSRLSGQHDMHAASGAVLS